MATIKSINTIPYSGQAYNLLVSLAGVKDSKQITLFNGYVHPDYPVYNNDGVVKPISQVEIKDIILDRDSNHWKVESIIQTEVDEDFYLIEFSDGRKLKCSLKHKLKIISPKNISVSLLSINDEIQDVSLDSIGKTIRSTERT